MNRSDAAPMALGVVIGMFLTIVLMLAADSIRTRDEIRAAALVAARERVVALEKAVSR